MFDNSTPRISSPWTEDFPSLDLKNPSSLDLKLFFNPDEIFGDFDPGKVGFLVFMSFIFPKIFDNLFLTCSDLDTLVLSADWTGFSCSIGLLSVFWFKFSFSEVCAVWTGCSFVIDFSVSKLVWLSTTSLWALCFFNLSLSARTSSYHFSKIGIASSRFVVPDEEIFCFPSI